MRTLKHMTNKWIIALLALALLGISGCESSDTETIPFDQTLLLENIGNSIIVPSYDQLNTLSIEMVEKTETFIENKTAQDLASLQNTWLKAAKKWMQTGIFNFGPIDELALHTSIENWPTNTIAIEESINSSNEKTTTFINSLGSSSKGLPAIEYLLFGNEGQSTTDLVNGFVNDENRGSFLLALTVNFNSITTELFKKWDASNENFISSFVNATGNDVGSSTNILANNLIVNAEILKNEKIGVPLGKKSLGELLPKNAEAWRSQNSITLIRENLLSLQQLFNGGQGIGYDDYLNKIEAKYEDQLLSAKINDQFDNCIDAIDQLSLPLTDGLVQEPEKIEFLYQNTQMLVVLLKTDMMSNLGLLVTFSDNDGD